MYANMGNVAVISGYSGAYDNFISNPNVRYGRNALNNYKGYLKNYNLPRIESNISPDDTFEVRLQKIQEFSQKVSQQQAQMPPINFKYSYMPIEQRGVVNQDAVLGAAYEEMGNRMVVSTQEMDTVLNTLSANQAQLTSSSMDLNKDGNIDIAEYSTSMLLADMLDEDGPVDVRNIDGIITNKGENKLLAYGLANNKDIAYKTYLSLYQGYNLSEACRKFVSDANNIIS